MAALGGATGPAQAQSERKTFVLVHGGWHGGWCWRRVADLLEKQGHKVVRPDPDRPSASARTSSTQCSISPPTSPTSSM